MLDHTENILRSILGQETERVRESISRGQK